MNTHMTILLGAALLGGFAAPAVAQATNARPKIEAQLKRYVAGTSAKDAHAVLATLSSDFRGRDIHGTAYTRQGAGANLQRRFAQAKAVHTALQIQRFQMANGHAEVRWREHTVLRTVGQGSQRPHLLVYDGVWQSVWRPTSKGWLMSSATQLVSKITRDGVADRNAPASPPAR